MLRPYNRPPIRTHEQLQHLKSKGLEVDDDEAAIRHIEEKGYYRLKAYLLPLRNADKEFSNGARFEAAIQLHDFDEKLRLLVFKHIQRVEIFIRNSLNEEMCLKSQNAFWYLDSSIFERSTTSYADTVNKLRSSFIESQETFAKHFRDQYFNEYCKFYSLMPPSWMAIELMTFGNLLTLLNSISSESIDEFKLDRWARKRIGPDKFKKLTNWMHCIRDVRNHCAHHNRLFNRNFPAPDGILRNLNKDIELISVEGSIKPQKQLNRLYTALACMQVISRKSGLTGIGPELANLFDSYPETANHLASMGFPQTWREEELFFPTPKQ